VAVRIRMKKLGRTHRPFYRICAMDQHAPRDGRAIEELGHYDPMVPETDARVVLKKERIDYWISVGAQPSDKVGVLIKKYGTDGSHLEQQAAAVERLAAGRPVPPPPVVEPIKEEEKPAEAEATTEEPAAEAPSEEAPAEESAE